MGHSEEEKAASHERIVAVASRRMRESGTAGPGVAEIMREAGLTHGGFYKHFASRDELVGEALEAAFAQSAEGTAAVVEGAADPLAAFVDWYASTAHCADPGSGCAVVSLAADVARSDAGVRAAYTAQVGRYLADLERLIGHDEARRRARTALSTLVGAVLVARAVDDATLADAVLADARAAVLALRDA